MSRAIQITPPSRIADGQQQVNTRCMHCNYQQTEYHTIPRIMERAIYPTTTGTSPSNTGGSSGGFGGGSSSGSGAGSSW
jgi:uncharacterized protein